MKFKIEIEKDTSFLARMDFHLNCAQSSAKDKIRKWGHEEKRGERNALHVRVNRFNYIDWFIFHNIRPKGQEKCATVNRLTCVVTAFYLAALSFFSHFHLHTLQLLRMQASLLLKEKREREWKSTCAREETRRKGRRQWIESARVNNIPLRRGRSKSSREKCM